MNLLLLLLVVVAATGCTSAQDMRENKILRQKKIEEHLSTCINNCQNEAIYNKPSEIEESLNDNRNTHFSYLSAIEEDLLRHDWEEQDQPCVSQLLKIVRNAQNSTLWATWIWDSMQFPVGQLYGSRNHLGNYDQCINLPWKDHPELRTQYCLAEFQLSDLDSAITNVDLLGPAENYIRYQTRRGLTFNKLSWGICGPAVCKQELMAKFASAIFKSTHLGQIKTEYNVSVNSEFCQVAGEIRKTWFLEHFFLALTITLVLITLMCTWYVDFKGAESITTSRFAKAFYIKSNARWLTKAEDKVIGSVLGIRLVLTFLVAGGHLWLTKQVFGIGNAGEIDKKWGDVSQCALFNIDVVVDMFFMISGLLLAKNVLEKKPETFNLIIIIARRYVRLTCSLLLILLVLPIVWIHGDTGPVVKKFLHHEIESWASNWWRNVLMIGNYGDTSQISYAVLWSLACDFHLFLIGILLYWIYSKDRKAGIKTYIIFTAASLIIPIIDGTLNNSGAVVSFDYHLTDNYRQLLGDPSYVRTHLRAGPYFVGLALGYFMAFYQPQKYRNALSKKSSVLAFVLFVAIFAGLQHICGLYHVRQYSPLEGALFSVARRNIFAALIGFLIMICEYGSLPLISDALSWSGLVPLSKLSYGVYLTHLMFIFRFVARTRYPLRSDSLDDIFSTFGMMAITFTTSLLMWLFWEAPVVNLFDIFFKRLASQQKQHTENNGSTNGHLNTAALDGEKELDSKVEKKLN